MQPYLLPYVGYFQLIDAVDIFVIYDDVQFIKGGWINRNFIQVAKRPHRVSLALDGASSNRLINEIGISDDFVRLRKTISMAYSRAPYFQSSMRLVERVLENPDRNLAGFVGHSVRLVAEELRIQTPVVFSSSLEYDRSLRGQDRLISLCELLGASTYINAQGGRALYDLETFESHGMELKFFESNAPSYKQFDDAFLPQLSILDALMFNGAEAVAGWMKAYELT